MNTESALQAAEKLLAHWAVETHTPEPNRVDIVIEAGALSDAVRALSVERWGYLAGITGLDLGIEAGAIEVLYHFCCGPAVITLRVHTPRDNATLPSIGDVIPSAILYERELREMLGIDVIGLTNLDHLFLPDDWPEAVYPLRKDAVLD